MPAAELVDPIQVVRRDDKTVKLAQVTSVWIYQAVHAVVVHCGLTPHTPAGGPERRNLVGEGMLVGLSHSPVKLSRHQQSNLSNKVGLCQPVPSHPAAVHYSKLKAD